MISPPAKEFSPQGYRELLVALLELGYSPQSFESARPEERHLVLRHDVDLSLRAALEMAEQEAALGVSATYFILLRTELYNPLSGAGLDALKRLRAMGHRIGLHFDAGLYAEDANLDTAARAEADILEAAARTTIAVVAQHRPGAQGVITADRLGGRINAYAARLFGPDRYCSDSGGEWKHGHPLDHAAIRAGRALQLLIHPFWWQAPALPAAERLRAFVAERAAFFDAELGRHCSVHRPRT